MCGKLCPRSEELVSRPPPFSLDHLHSTSHGSAIQTAGIWDFKIALAIVPMLYYCRGKIIF